MASLTPLSKGLIGLAVVGAMASAVWHLGLKERMQGYLGTAQQAPTAEAPAVQASPKAAPAVVDTTAPAAKPDSVPMPANAARTKTQASSMTAAENTEAGRKLLESGNHDKARIHLEQAVQGGDGGAACLLGEMTLKGQGGLATNQEKAAALFQLAQSRNIICFASGQ